MANKPSYSDQAVVLIGIAAMLLAAVLYVWFDFAPDLPPSE
jgi:hypothetical protein